MRDRQIAVTVALLATVAAHSSSVWGQSSLPINGPAAAKYNKAFHDLELQVADDYVKRTKDAEALRDEGRKLLYEVKQLMLGLPPTSDVASYHNRANDLIARGSHDPLIAAVAVQTQSDFTKKDELTAACRQAMADVVEQYGPREQVDVIDRCHNVLREIANGNLGEREKYPQPNTDVLGDAYVRWIAAEADDLDAQRRIYTLLDAQFNDRRAYRGRELVYIAKQSRAAKAHAWMRHMLEAYVLMFEGRELCLSDDERYEPLWKAAGEHYAQAWKLAPQFPQAAAESIQLARGGHVPETPRVWFERAITAEFDNSDAYDYFRTHLRNEGSEALVKFGIECAKSRRFDTAVPMELIECLWAVENHSGENGYEMEGAYEAVRDLCQAGLKSPVYAGQPQNAATRAWLVATHIAVAARAGRFDDVGPLWDQTDEGSLARAATMHNVTMTLPEIKEAADTAVLGGAKLVNDVEAALVKTRDAKSLVAAVEKIEAAAKVLGPDHPRTRNWRAAVAIYKPFFAGQWAEISLPPDAVTLAGAKNWKRVDERTLTTRGTHPYPLAMLAHIPPPYELSLEIATAELADDVLGAGVQIGSAFPVPNRLERGRLFGVSSLDDRAGLPLEGGYWWEVKCKPVNELRVRIWPGHFQVFVNGAREIDEAAEDFDPTGSVSLWAPGGEDSATKVGFRNLRIRQLAFSAPPDPADHAERVAYCDARIKDEPELLELYLDRGEALMAVGRAADAKADFLRLIKARPKWVYAQIHCGMALAALGEFPSAIEHYEQASKAEPENHLALERLAWLRATCKDERYRDGKQAVELAKRAVDMCRGTIHSYSATLAAAHAEAGEFEAANNVLRQLKSVIFEEDHPGLQPVMRAIEANLPYREK